MKTLLAILLFSASALAQNHVFGVVNPAAVSPNTSPVELGLLFSSDVSGYINGVRFWRPSSATSDHTASLWDGTGHLLATAAFTNEGGSGWQQVNFPVPILVQHDTTYVASVHTAGAFAYDLSYFDIPVIASPLRAFRGVYAYGGSQFPTLSYPGPVNPSSNYWVDVDFAIVPPASIQVTPTSEGLTLTRSGVLGGPLSGTVSVAGQTAFSFPASVATVSVTVPLAASVVIGENGQPPPPPPQPTGVRIMALGDSLTFGYPGPANSYRQYLAASLAGIYTVAFVGSVQDSAGQWSEGHSGWRADELGIYTGSWAGAAQCDIALVMAGTNDVGQGQGNVSTIGDLAGIIDGIRSQRPDAKILLAQIPPESILHDEIIDLNARIATLAQQKGVTLVDMYTGFDVSTMLLSDGTHPTTSGAAFMAGKWAAALLPLLQ